MLGGLRPNLTGFQSYDDKVSVTLYVICFLVCVRYIHLSCTNQVLLHLAVDALAKASKLPQLSVCTDTSQSLEVRKMRSIHGIFLYPNFI